MFCIITLFCAILTYFTYLFNIFGNISRGGITVVVILMGLL